MRKPAILLLVLTAFCISSCHFGHSAEEIMNKYKDVERDLVFSFTAPTPGGSTRVYMEDHELSGVSTRWEGDEAIALFDFGEVFVEPKNAISLGYEDDADDIRGVDFAKFKGQARAKMGENVFDGKDFALMFPYKDFGKLPSTSTTAELDFNGQNGTLDLLRKRFLYAWGYAFGKCKDSEVTLYESQSSCSSHQDWHSHATESEEIVLDNKMSIIRFSMIAGQVTPETTDTVWMRLTEYLNNKNLKIDRITVAGDSASLGFSRAIVSLRNGIVTPSSSATPSLTVLVTDPLKEIEERDATPVSLMPGAEKVAWGTTFYLSIPCTMSGKLPISPLLTVTTVDKNTGNPGETYYGSLSYKMLKEGDYYMTAPIKVVDSMAKLQEETPIYLYYHSSFVFDVDDLY